MPFLTRRGYVVFLNVPMNLSLLVGVRKLTEEHSAIVL